MFLQPSLRVHRRFVLSVWRLTNDHKIDFFEKLEELYESSSGSFDLAFS